MFEYHWQFSNPVASEFKESSKEPTVPHWQCGLCYCVPYMCYQVDFFTVFLLLKLVWLQGLWSSYRRGIVFLALLFIRLRGHCVIIVLVVWRFGDFQQRRNGFVSGVGTCFTLLVLFVIQMLHQHLKLVTKRRYISPFQTKGASVEFPMLRTANEKTLLNTYIQILFHNMLLGLTAKFLVSCITP